jgi:hypothetical protein
VRLPGLSPEEVALLAPIAREPGAWLMLDKGGRLHRVDLARGRSEATARSP